MDLAVFFGAWTPDDLPEHFAGLRPKFPLDYNLQWCWTFSPWGLRILAPNVSWLQWRCSA